ncbi:uncharacterized protein B0H64DRAFT_455999 [Chaetomium fimeti]|uniref:Uncharacterized protein n=1 Tax=Chaetomium fimeti TaxID=1854472 RepID=A0AAE0HHX2_9PEZI|nr:hypothetical protein B0H64DRAFT_455999 [Chaetomium fimeti]
MAPDNIHFLAVCRYITSVFFCVLALAAIKISYTVLRHVTLVLPDFVSVVQTKVWTSFPSIPPRVHVVVFIVCVLVDPPLFLVYITCIIFLPLWLAAIRISYAVARHVIIRLPAFVEVLPLGGTYTLPVPSAQVTGFHRVMYLATVIVVLRPAVKIM